mgnify:CR=1 FL=1
MKFVLYLPIFVIFQFAGEKLKTLFNLPIPSATIGMILLLIFLFIIPENQNINNAAQKLLLHLPLFFIPAGVGIMQYTDILQDNSLALIAAVLGSTIFCFVFAAWLTQRLLKSETS